MMGLYAMRGLKSTFNCRFPDIAVVADGLAGLLRLD